MSKQPKDTSQMKNADIMNAIRTASESMKEVMPQSVTADNIEAYGNAITSYSPTMNEFLNVLVNRIAKEIISSKMARNKLAKFKNGSMYYGKDIEEIFVDLIQKATFDDTLAETEVFKKNKPNVKAIFHRENRRDMYKTTVSKDQLKKAFRSEGGLGKLLTAIVNSMYSSNTNDEYKYMKQLLSDYSTGGAAGASLFKKNTVVAPTDTATTKALAQAIKKQVLQMGFMSTQYNAQGVNTYSDPEDLVLFVTPQVAVMMDTELLAYAFNMEKFDTNTQLVVVDDFGSGLAKAQAILVDKNWFQVYDTNLEFESLYNPQGLYWNYYLHVWSTLSTSQFQNAVTFETA